MKQNVYTTYKAEKDGQLQIKTEQYVTSANVDGTAVSAETVNDKRVYKINTEAGKTYAINFTLGIPFFVATSEVVEVKEGAIDMPYVMKEGDNSIPPKPASISSLTNQKRLATSTSLAMQSLPATNLASINSRSTPPTATMP